MYVNIKATIKTIPSESYYLQGENSMTSITEYCVGRDLKDHLIQTFLPKTQSRQGDPESCLAES